jgi:hypothetical protein
VLVDRTAPGRALIDELKTISVAAGQAAETN